MSVYMLSGLICAFAGWAMIGRFGSVSPTAGPAGQHRVDHRVVIGGISLFGGRGSILGAVRRADRRRLHAGPAPAGADAQWTYLLIGLLIIAAVTVDQWIRKVSA
jgi:fructose transport system permease protein